MLIITVETSASKVNVLLDGSLAGPAVGEVARSWLAKAFEWPPQHVSLDLRGVTSVDRAGSECLAQTGEINARSETDSRSTMLCVEGTLRAPVDGVLRSTVESLFHSGARRVVLDLSGVSDIDAAGVGELIRLFDMAAAAGGAVEIAKVSPHVHHLLDVAGVLGILSGGSVAS